MSRNQCAVACQLRTTLVRLIVAAFTSLLIALGAARCDAQASSPCDLDCQLLKAAKTDGVALVRHLLAKGADVEAKDQTGTSALAIAAEHGNIAIAKLLLEKGADPKAKNQYDETALIEAARNANSEMVGLLLGKTPDVEQMNQALIEATHSGPVVVELEDPTNKPNKPGNKTAPESSWVKTVKLLLDKGANLEAWDQYLGTPLLSAAEYGQTDIVVLLLQRGADIHATDSYGNTPLIAAACECAVATMNSTYDIVQLLLRKGSDVNARNREGKTALMNAALGPGDAAIVKLLLDNGADSAVEDIDGKTALMYAVESERSDKIQLLKKAIQ